MEVIGEMADLLARHKLIPFFGAGISRQHLGFAADELASQMASCDETRMRQVALGTTNLLADGNFNPHIATDYEVTATARIMENSPFAEALEAYRATFDLTHVPQHLQQEAENQFVELVAKADPTSTEDWPACPPRSLIGLPPEKALTATAHVMAACNRRPVRAGFDSLCSLICGALPEHGIPVAACAVALLHERGEVISENFRQLASWWFRDYETSKHHARTR